MITFELGTTYPIEHLRPFDLELAKAGHPLAMVNGHAVRAFRAQGDNCFAFDWWNGAAKWLQTENAQHTLCFNLRLAPLAVRDGRPLHVGDEIEVRHATKGWLISSANLTDYHVGLYRYVFQDNGQLAWRWPTQ